VDLVVTGLKYGRDGSRGRDQLLKVMQKLYECLLPLQADGKVYKINYIPTANVPIIKLVGDLEVIN